MFYNQTGCLHTVLNDIPYILFSQTEKNRLQYQSAYLKVVPWPATPDSVEHPGVALSPPIGTKRTVGSDYTRDSLETEKLMGVRGWSN